MKIAFVAGVIARATASGRTYSRARLDPYTHRHAAGQANVLGDFGPHRIGNDHFVAGVEQRAERDVERVHRTVGEKYVARKDVGDAVLRLAACRRARVEARGCRCSARSASSPRHRVGDRRQNMRCDRKARITRLEAYDARALGLRPKERFADLDDFPERDSVQSDVRRRSLRRVRSFAPLIEGSGGESTTRSSSANDATTTSARSTTFGRVTNPVNAANRSTASRIARSVAPSPTRRMVPERERLTMRRFPSEVVIADPVHNPYTRRRHRTAARRQCTSFAAKSELKCHAQRRVTTSAADQHDQHAEAS